MINQDSPPSFLDTTGFLNGFRQGLFAGRFIYINRTAQGELFGSDRNSNVPWPRSAEVTRSCTKGWGTPVPSSICRWGFSLTKTIHLFHIYRWIFPYKPSIYIIYGFPHDYGTPHGHGVFNHLFGGWTLAFGQTRVMENPNIPT